MEKARCNTELYSNLRVPLNNVKPSNFWGSHHFDPVFLYIHFSGSALFPLKRKAHNSIYAAILSDVLELFALIFTTSAALFSF